MSIFRALSVWFLLIPAVCSAECKEFHSEVISHVREVGVSQKAGYCRLFVQFSGENDRIMPDDSCGLDDDDFSAPGIHVRLDKNGHCPYKVGDKLVGVIQTSDLGGVVYLEE
jgi:hypothetical protein